ncbi:diacylglycerol O-acyltransferase 1 [Entomophthora muscae]|uniref:Diacylglycerol O-acyltransferase 1 n=1 Tax=Entomophthora muscae TaxID=34485 RepID=A0ACC2RKR9_9FUNG|nr:diacylglycerol O-acyltransferase 1 [Entomophthora muscae]
MPTIVEKKPNPVDHHATKGDNSQKKKASAEETQASPNYDESLKPTTDSEEEHVDSLKKSGFAPLDVPMARRKQTFAVFIAASAIFVLQALFYVAWLNPLLWPVLIGYLIFMAFDQTPETGGRKLDWVRRLPLWKWYADYFPARLIAEATLDPQRNYIFGYHPHGIISTGVFANFCTEATGISDIFPGLNIRALTLVHQFLVPFYREFVLSIGLASVSSKSITHILNSGPGNSCLIVVGGVEEVLEARPTVAKLVLARRCGFVRMAIKNGADLVPVFGFGENQLYEQPDNSVGSWTRTIQTFSKRTFGIAFPIFHGRGIFNYSFGTLPYRHPLTVITGAPIRVEKNPNPSEEMVQAVHKQYIDALTDLYNRNKNTYWVGSEPPELTFV